MFKRAHHARIARVLGALDADFLAASRCYFGGGTAIALRHGEYRESVDIDFLVSNPSGYADLREKVSGPNGFGALTRQQIPALRPVRADRYGIRTVLAADEQPIKFEIVLEARIELEIPGPNDRICGVAALTELDMATSKLLANCDRWADRAVFSRDIIDLAMMNPAPALMSRAIKKAESAYRSAVIGDLGRAIDNLRDNPHRLGDCMRALNMEDTPKAVVWDRIARLRPLG